MSALLLSGAPLVIGHRGAAGYAPENTIESIRYGIRAGADAIEIDVRLSSDGEVVLCHDPDVERTTGARGFVNQLSLRQLRELDAGATFKPRSGTRPAGHSGIRIPTLQEVLETFPDTHFIVELKSSAAEVRTLEVLRETHAIKRSVLASFDGNAVRQAREKSMPTGATRAEVFGLLARSISRSRAVPRCSMVFLPRRYHGVPVPHGPFLRVARLARIPLHVWVENNPSVAQRLWLAGVAGIVTDDPASLVKARNALQIQRH